MNNILLNVFPFATSVVDTGGAHWAGKNLIIFKKIEDGIIRGPGEKSLEKNIDKKKLVKVSL